jgi:hypothetical protein
VGLDANSDRDPRSCSPATSSAPVRSGPQRQTLTTHGAWKCCAASAQGERGPRRARCAHHGRKNRSTSVSVHRFRPTSITTDLSCLTRRVMRIPRCQHGHRCIAVVIVG